MYKIFNFREMFFLYYLIKTIFLIFKYFLLYIKQVFFNNTDIYFNNFLQCDYNCDKVKQILNL